MATETVKTTSELASLDDVLVLVFGDRVWGKGPTLRAALDKARKPRKYVAFVVHKDTYVDDLGSLQYPLPFALREILRRGLPKEKPADGPKAKAAPDDRGRG